MKDYLVDTHAHIDMLESPLVDVFAKMSENGIKNDR